MWCSPLVVDHLLGHVYNILNSSLICLLLFSLVDYPYLNLMSDIFHSELIDNVVAVAEHTADELIKTDGREVRLDEDEQLQLPFLLPEDGYSCDIIRGVPQGLQEFLQLLIETGMLNFMLFRTVMFISVYRFHWYALFPERHRFRCFVLF